MLKKIILKIVPKKHHEKLNQFVVSTLTDNGEKFYSQEGEDMVLRKHLSGIKNGFFVDIGAHHPTKFSNTYYFYKKGWTGINVDAMPGSMKLFNKKRPKDINLEFAVSDKKEKLTYYAFEESALNGFSDQLSLVRGKREHKILFKKIIETKTLAEILNKYMPKKRQIDFMTIDVEGLDYQVLKSNDWKKFAPKFILIEILHENISQVFDSKIFRFLRSKKYEFVAKTDNTIIFRKLPS